MVWTDDARGHLARSLQTLLKQVDEAYPDRDKLFGPDGTIGDDRHQTRVSDHNRNSHGDVQALDITHDPKHGFDSYKFAEHLRQVRDDRTKYVISNHRWFLGHGANAWKWQPYYGQNPHDHHIHVSVSDARGSYDNQRPWDIGPTMPPVLDAPSVPAHPFLKKGMVSDDVKTLQQLLKVGADGIFGEKTEAAVKAFQRSAGLVVDGLVGLYTWNALLKKE